MMLVVLALMLAAAQTPQPPQPLAGDQLIAALRRGGYVLVMRHASSPRQPPTKEAADDANVDLERQLDKAGRATSAAMGEALRTLNIPIGEVLTSPTYRARQTAQFARLPNPQPQDELGDGGQSMQGVSEAQAAWLKKRVAQLPPRGSNTILITHLPNIERAFPQWASGLADGEALVFGAGPGADAQSEPTVVARIRIDQWPTLAR